MISFASPSHINVPLFFICEANFLISVNTNSYNNALVYLSCQAWSSHARYCYQLNLNRAPQDHKPSLCLQALNCLSFECYSRVGWVLLQYHTFLLLYRAPNNIPQCKHEWSSQRTIWIKLSLDLITCLVSRSVIIRCSCTVCISDQ